MEERKVRKAKVLIVDDNFIGFRILPHYLKKHWQVCVDEAQNGKIGIKMISENQYDLVIMDIFMPVMDGFEATKAIRAIEGEYFQKVPIFGLLHMIDEEFIARVIQCGMTGWLEKPINLDQLTQKLSIYLK